MFRILHFSLHKNIPLGVINQLGAEYKAKKCLSQSVSWDTVVFSHDSSNARYQICIPSMFGGSRKFGLVTNYIRLRRQAYKWLRENAAKYDVVLLRYRSGDPFLLRESRWFNNVFTLHHTKEIEEAKTRYGQGGRIEKLVENYAGKKILTMTKGIIGVTHEIVNYELERTGLVRPSYCYPNGIWMDDVQLSDDNRNDCPKFVFIASIYTQWHGLELVIEELLRYRKKFMLHIVGIDGVNVPVNDPRIKFHGKQNRSYIQKILSDCDVGLGSFNLSRIGLSEACHLKVREYLAAGLPVYSAYRDAGIPDDFPYYKIGKVCADEMIDYAVQTRKYRRENVRLSSEQYIDKAVLMNNLVGWLENVAQS
jgi:glycosyltransferase involved in cell wall biosynthesis